MKNLFIALFLTMGCLHAQPFTMQNAPATDSAVRLGILHPLHENDNISGIGAVHVEAQLPLKRNLAAIIRLPISFFKLNGAEAKTSATQSYNGIGNIYLGVNGLVTKSKNRFLYGVGLYLPTADNEDYGSAELNYLNFPYKATQTFLPESVSLEATGSIQKLLSKRFMAQADLGAAVILDTSDDSAAKTDAEDSTIGLHAALGAQAKVTDDVAVNLSLLTAGITDGDADFVDKMRTGMNIGLSYSINPKMHAGLYYQVGIDDQWGKVGSNNFNNGSIGLNFGMTF